ncbi:hypothetical protein A4U64_27410 (plasmid) [Rhodococcus sp. WB1]|nr:hypothetical protein A4U64_27410 [Rhodococcus sp. WB1]
MHIPQQEVADFCVGVVDGSLLGELSCLASDEHCRGHDADDKRPNATVTDRVRDGVQGASGVRQDLLSS